MGTAYQKQGYMSEAFGRILVYGQKDLGLSKMAAYTREVNVASRRLLEKKGLVLNKYILELGEVCSQAIYVYG